MKCLRSGQKNTDAVAPHQYLIDETDSWSLAAIQEVDIDDLQLLQTDVKGFELAVLAVQGDHLEQTVVQPQTNHATLRIHNSDNARL